MLTRRRFAGCALCAGLGLIAAEAPGQSPAITRTILRRMDVPDTNYVNVLARVEIGAGGLVARHTHPGIESSFVQSGRGTLLVDGQTDLALGPGVSFQVPPRTPHSARGGDTPMLILISYVVEKDKPLASPA